MSVSLKGPQPDDRHVGVLAVDSMIQQGQLPVGLIAHDTWLDAESATHEQCLRILAVAMLFHPTYGGDKGYFAREALGTSQPAHGGLEQRICGPLPPELLTEFDPVQDDRMHYEQALRALRWIITG